MALISCFPIAWQIPGHIGGNTVLRFLGDATQSPITNPYRASIEDWASRLIGQIPNEVTWSFGVPHIGTAWQTEGELINDVDGDISATIRLPIRAPRNGTGTGAWKDGVGIRLELVCAPAPGEVRPLVGHYKFVPWVGQGGSAGQVIEAQLTTARNAMSNWLAGCYTRGTIPCVWRRPKPGRAGIAMPVLSTRVRAQFTQVTHRRRLIYTYPP